MNTAKELIERSIFCNEIAHGAYTEDTALELEVLSDDSTENGDVIEYWGDTDAGHAWRVHLDRLDRRI